MRITDMITQVNLLDILSISPHYFCRKWIGATNENSCLILGFKGLTDIFLDEHQELVPAFFLLFLADSL